MPFQSIQKVALSVDVEVRESNTVFGNYETLHNNAVIQINETRKADIPTMHELTLTGSPGNGYDV